MKTSVIFLALVGALFANDAPYSLVKFRLALNLCKLQAPFSHYDARWGAKYGKFKNFSNKYFFLTDGKYMTFFMCQEKKRRKEVH